MVTGLLLTIADSHPQQTSVIRNSDDSSLHLLTLPTMALFSSLNWIVQLLALPWPAKAASKLLASALKPNVTSFAVHSLPNVSFDVTPSWAGQIPIPDVADDQLFFWLFQAENHNASRDFIGKAKEYLLV